MGPSRRGAGPRPAARAAWILAAALAAGSAQAQSVAFGPAVPVPAATPPAQAALAPYSSPPAFDLFVAEPRSTAPSAAFLYRHGDLASVAFPWDPLPTATCFTAGSWVGSVQDSSGDGLADLGWCYGSTVGYQFSPDLPIDYLPLFNGDPIPTGLAFARLLDRTDLVLAIGERQGIEIAADPWDTHFTSDHFYRYPYSTVLPDSGDTFALQPLQLGDVARTAGLHDLAWSRVGLPDLFLLWTLVDSSTADPANWDWALLTFSGAREVRGAGAVDVDGDGIPDIVAVVVPTTGSAQLKAVHNPGTPFSLRSTTTLDFTATPDVGAALGLAAPSFAAPLDLDGVPAVAVFDAGATPPRLHVVTANPAGGLLDWNTANLAGTGVTQILAGDLVGSAAGDMVAVFTDGAIQVWPGDLPPSIAWAPGSPPAAVVGTLAPLVLAVDASDPDGQVASVALDIQGQPSGIAPVQSGTSYAFTIPVATLCALTPSASAAVRATDDLGVWREVAAPIDISDAPALAVPGAGSTLAVSLLPGGTTVTLTAQVADGCGRDVSVCWADQGLPAGCTTVQGVGTSTHTIAVPESAYPAMVAGGEMSMSMSVTVTATAGGVPALPATVELGFDASGLLAADHRSDRTALAPGELALLTTTLRSRIGVTLPQVALDDRLVGLAAAGPVRVSGAVVLAQRDGPGGLSVTLDQVPGGGAPVVIELPVRLLEGAGSGSSRAQAVAASSRVPLSPAAEAVTPKAARAGLSCGSGGGSPLALLGLALYMGVVRRARARIRSTSSRILMRRQA